MSEGLVEEKNLKTKAMDQKEDNRASPKEAVTSSSSSSQPLSTSSPLSPRATCHSEFQLNYCN
jgi:hypothetical protein